MIIVRLLSPERSWLVGSHQSLLGYRSRHCHGINYTGAADKAVNLVGCKSPHHQLPGYGWLADPMHAEATKHVLLGCQSLGCPAAMSRSGRNDRGGEQTWGPEHKEMAAVSKKRSVMKSFRREYAGSRPG